MINRLRNLFNNTSKVDAEKEELKKTIIYLKEDNFRLKADEKLWRERFGDLFEAYKELREQLKEENK